MKTAIGMAREIAATTSGYEKSSPASAMYREGQFDRTPAVQSALAMHTARQAEIDELVEGLEHILNGALSLPRFAETEGRALIAKHKEPKP